MTETERRQIDAMVNRAHDVTGRRRGVLYAAVAVLGLLFGVVWGIVAFIKVSDQAADGAQLAQDIGASCAVKPVSADLLPFCPRAEQVVEAGPVGEPGPAGKNGKDGEDGQDGVNGINGLNGQKGEKGDPGEDGKDGADGSDGAPGPMGPPGPKGDTGDTGVVQVRTVGCEGPIIHNVSSTYNETTKVVTITCNQ